MPSLMTFFFSWTSVTLRQWMYLLVALTIVIVTGITSMLNEKNRASIDLSMNGSRAMYGLTVASSHYGFNTPLYSYYLPIYHNFLIKKTVSWDTVNGMIDTALATDPATLTPENLFVGFGELLEDDKGVLLWYTAAFKLFGPHLEGIYMLYFLLLSASITIFWITFRDDEPALLLMTLYPLVHLALSVYALASNTNVVGSLFGTRPFCMLAVLPVLHLALLTLSARSVTPWLAAGGVLQIVYLLFIITVRSSAKVQILFLLLVAAFALVRWLRAEGWAIRRATLRQNFVWIPASLLIGTAGVAVSYIATVPSEVRGQGIPGHLAWHNVLGSFVLNDVLADDLLQFARVTIDYKSVPVPDALARISVIGYAKTVQGKDIEELVIGYPLSKRDTSLYERTGRSLFFYELKRRPLESARLFVVQKTRMLVDLLKNIVITVSSIDILIAALFLGMVGGSAWLRGLKKIAPLIAGGFTVSVIPAYAFVAAPHIMYDYAPYFYLGFLGAVASVGALLTHNRHLLMRWLRPCLRIVRPGFIVVVIPLAIAGLLLAKRLPSAGDISTILIVSATYGGNVKAPTGNATDHVRRTCNGREKCSYKVDVNKLGDPMGGAGKDFVVEYECSHTLKPLKQTIPAEAHMHKVTLDCRA